MTQFIGIDLAWREATGEKAANETGFAILDETGEILDAGWLVGIDAVAEWLIATAEPGAVIAIDAPLVVANATRQRLCEREVGQAFGRWKVSANSTNLGSPRLGGVRLRELLEAAGFTYGDGSRPPDGAAKTIFECYPYTTIVGTHEFDYSERPPYKRQPKGVPIAAHRLLRAEACNGLIEKIVALSSAIPSVRLDSHVVTRILIQDKSPIADRDYKHREDLIDAVLSAWTAAIFSVEPDRIQVLGSADPLRDDGGRKATILGPARGWQWLKDRPMTSRISRPKPIRQV